MPQAQATAVPYRQKYVGNDAALTVENVEHVGNEVVVTVRIDSLAYNFQPYRASEYRQFEFRIPEVQIVDSTGKIYPARRYNRSPGGLLYVIPRGYTIPGGDHARLRLYFDIGVDFELANSHLEADFVSPDARFLLR